MVTPERPDPGRSRGAEGAGDARERARVEGLLEELLETGRTPEEACAATPELLPAVRQRLARLRGLEEDLAILFPAGSAPAPAAEAPLPPLPGYEVRSVLGRGGMGVVYRAHHARLGRDVALKMLLAGPYASPRELERFLSEARAVANLCHANIVQVYDAGELDGRPYFTMELVAGGSLAQRLEGAPQPAATAAEWMVVLARAVAFAHASGIVHRDLKPANVLLTPDGTLKIADFGLARRVDERQSGSSSGTSSGAVVGTPSYMAPEQVRGVHGAVGPAVDVYALGAILYEMLTGRPPFRSDSPWATQAQILAQDPVPPSRLNARVPRDLETICLTCLGKDPARRYASAAALAEDLLRFQQGRPIAARPAGRLEHAARWVRRNPSRAALVVSVAALLVLGGLAGAREWTLAARERVDAERLGERLASVRELQQAGRFDEAHAVLARLPRGGSAALRAQLGEAEAELRLVERLEAIHARRGEAGRTDRYAPETAEAYAAVFAEAGLGALGDPIADVAARVAASPARAALVAALDDWALCVSDRGELAWLLEVARRADPDPWRDRLRDPTSWEDAAALHALEREVVPAGQPPALLLMLAGLLDHVGTDSTAFLRRVQLAHPADYWVNRNLGEVLAGRPEEIGYLRAALAVRPRDLAVCTNLAIALENARRFDEAWELWRRTLEIAPGIAPVQFNLAIFHLTVRAAFEPTEVHAREALRLDPSHPVAHAVLGQALLELGRFAEAAEVLRIAGERAPPSGPARDAVEAQSADAERMLALDARFPLEPGPDERLAGEEFLVLALRAQRRGRAADAVELYTRAFATDPGLEEAPGTDHRYRAACAAARAGQLEQALHWLWSELAARTVSLEAGRAEERDALARELAGWEFAFDLSALREPEALAALPPGARDECLALWAEVKALRTEAEGASRP